MIKGYQHNVYHNTAFDNENTGSGNDILVMIEQGGNAGTVTRNNAANKIAGHRSGTYADYPVPGTYGAYDRCCARPRPPPPPPGASHGPEC